MISVQFSMGVGSSADLIGTAESIALRVPNSTLTVALLKETGPLAITSANPSGLCDCTHHNKVDAIIAGKIDFILADGASPMTIASSVVDVRNLDNDELFFYRVGCVPEEYIWGLLNNTKSDAEPMLAVDLHSVNAHTQIIKSFMSHITKLVGCDAYRVYLLTSDDEGDGPSSDTTSTILKTPWTELTPRVQSAFQSGTSYYDGESEVTEKQSQMVVPLRDTTGKIIAVLELMKKVANAGQYISFKSDDLTYASLVSALLSENISTKVVSPLAQEMKAVVSSERGYRQAGTGLDIQSMHKPPRDTRGSFKRRSSF